MSTTSVPPTTNTTDYELRGNYHILEGIYIFSLIYTFIVAAITVLVNGLTLYAIYKDPLKCFRNPLALFVTGVIAADFVTGLIGEPIILAGITHAWKTGEEIGFHIIIVGFVVFVIATTVSFLTLLALAISQLLAIGWMRRYERCVSVRTVKIGLSAIWAMSIIVSIVLAVLSFWLAFGIMILDVTLCTIALVIVYIISYNVFRKRVSRDQNPLENQPVTKEFLKGTFILVLVQIVTVWPYVATSIAVPIYYSSSRRNSDEWINIEIARALSNLLFLAKFAIDPIILVWRIPKYKRSLKKVYANCSKCCGCKEEETGGRAAYNETRREDFDEDSHENVNVEVI